MLGHCGLEADSSSSIPHFGAITIGKPPRSDEKSELPRFVSI